MSGLRILLRIVSGLDRISSQEVYEKLNPKKLELSPYGPQGWIRCEIGSDALGEVRRLRSVIEAYILLYEAQYDPGFSIDRFADETIEAIPEYAPSASRISVSAYSVQGKPGQREIQGAFSKRIAGKLNAECNLRNYDTALRITLLKNIAFAAIDLEILPGNLPRKLETHPTALLPPIAYSMVRLASPKEEESLIDPMCGCGTIPLMAALEWKHLKVTGSDISSEYVGCAERNALSLGLAGKVKFLVSDIADLSRVGVRANIVAVNPPYGIARPTDNEIGKVFDILLTQSSKALSGDGRILVITPYPQIVEEVVSKHMLEISSAYSVLEGELPRTLHVIRKT